MCNIHLLSLLYTWSHLLYLHYQVPDIYIIWLHQMQALKLVGLAFEINANTIYSRAKENVIYFRIDANEPICEAPSTSDIVAYSFCFIGLHKGPYFRWKIYSDHFEQPFSKLSQCWDITELKITKACIFMLIYLLMRSKYSTQLYQSPAFYTKYGMDFRFLYNIPLSIMYVLRYEAAAFLVTSVCTETGFGVYPQKSLPIPGHGPMESTDILPAIDKDEIEEEFSFASLKCFSNKKVLVGPRMKDTIRGWDMPTRYWFWANIYKGLIRSNKEIRSAMSFMAWTIWCGPTLPNCILSSTLWVYLQLEAEYMSLYDTQGSMKVPWDIGFSIMRLFCLIYITPCLVLDDTRTVLRYYNSIFWVYHIILLVLMGVSVVVHKVKRVHS
ncbi:lysophospholipid acyltransferase 7-like isoform X2 [Aricia agestis]|uniref:lysophospholipid acyltransferase 7-like isoform X2 n=1 Tax=Aricia agestis TaxID=91739 RepID=UPI001C206CF9|nr:lysophospholipid acyltransferase 7-like isoform X2 [Aricia agestis]